MGTLGYIFFGTWAVLGAANLYLLYGTKDVKRKRKLFPLSVTLAGGLMLVFIMLFGFPLQVILVAVPSIILISFLNLKFIKFCDSCGSTVKGSFLNPSEHCHKCGAMLNDK